MTSPLLRPKHRPLRFALAGAANTAFGLAFYPSLLWTFDYFREHYLIALGIAQAVCLCFAFATYKLGVFRTRGNIVREFVAFSSFYLVNFAANWVALPLLVEFGHISPIIVQTGFSAIIMVGSYFWHSNVTFASAEKSE